MVSFGFLCIKAYHLYFKLFWLFLFLYVSLQTHSIFFLFFCLRFEALYSKGMKKIGSSCYRHASIWDAFSFFCLLLCWQWPCSWLPLWMLRCDPHNPTLSTTYLKKGLDFFALSKVFSVYKWIIHTRSDFTVLLWWICLLIYICRTIPAALVLCLVDHIWQSFWSVFV